MDTFLRLVPDPTVSEMGDHVTNLVVLCDFDGTITRIDAVEYVLAKLAQGDWKLFEKQYQRGEITLEDCLRKQLSLVRASKTQILNELGDQIVPRPHFGELVECCKKNGIPLIIVSAGLDFVIKHFLELNSWQSSVETYAAKTRFGTNGMEFKFPRLFDKKSANFKEDLVKHHRDQGETVIYVGDGVSDYAAVKNASLPFVVKGSKLAKICEDHGLACQHGRLQCRDRSSSQDSYPLNVSTTKPVNLS